MPSRVVGRRPRRGWGGLVGLVWAAGFGVFELWRGGGALAVLLIVLAVIGVLLQSRPATVVDSTAIRRPWRWRRRIIDWAQVEAITTPPPTATFGIVTRVALVGESRSVMLDDIPVDQAALVARIGGRPLRPPPTFPVPTLATTPPREKIRTDSDVEADVARRATALTKRWADLESENRHRPVGRDRATGTPSTPHE